ncbi:hypothetical protein PAN31108_00115 [Pandoraea anhela]|uniref:Uncharacterized protein n=1 Tax=Pandoraea anhela TaxID=2508295 RepID=A0A5E4RCX0_9BURK|nr:hypothetical protein PAN31108_00115 [Pandoraea anhela]
MWPSSSGLVLGSLTAKRGGRLPRVPPVIGVDFLDDDVREMRRFVQHAFERFRHFTNDLSLLLDGIAFPRDADADEWHNGLL